MNYGRNAATLTQREVTEDDVYADAWRIANPGAVNPVAVAVTLAESAKVIMHLTGDTASVRNHPALKAIAGQLAMLFDVSKFGAEISDYDAVQKRAESLT